MLYSVTISRSEDSWVCDDRAHLIQCAPFTQVTSQLFSELQIRQGIPGETLSLTFSDEPFDDHQLSLNLSGVSHDGAWHTYQAEDMKMELTVSSLLGTYFQHPPKQVFLAIDVCEDIG